MGDGTPDKMKKAELKIEYDRLVEDNRSLKYKLSIRNDKISALTQENDMLTGYKNSIEGRESQVLVENKWLKDTLRLVIIPAHRKFMVRDMTAQTFEERSWE